MRLVRFSLGGAPAVPGLLVDGHVLALSEILPDLPKDTCDVIAQWDRIKAAVDADAVSNGWVPLNQVKLHAPIARPGKILGIGLNYADHIAESKEAGLTIPTEQVWFSKQPTAVNDPNGDIELPKVSPMLDYEVELVAVIGKKGRHISPEDAPGHVFGYAVGNDVTVRDW